MKSIIERIKKGQFWKFHGGITPPEQKFLTNDKPIRTIELPPELIVPLQQHIGQVGELLVKTGDKVLKGQALTEHANQMCVPIHAPTSGTVNAIKQSTIAHPSGLTGLCVFITPDGDDKWVDRTSCEDYLELSRPTIMSKIANAGIAGMGGAGFPTHIKLQTQSAINFLIINAAECEPYITADDLLIREQSSTIVDGIKILDYLLQPKQILIGIEDNKPDAIKALKFATKELDNVTVCVLPTKYPTGGEKQLIKVLTGLEVPSGKLPLQLGIVMQNIATCFAIADAVINDTPLIRRVVTVSGQALDKPQNLWALLGTPINYLLTQCGLQQTSKKHLIMGGPMMGFSLANDNVPVSKTTNCILAPSEQEISSQDQEVDCIRCGQCADVCPSQLLPQELQWSAKAKDNNQLLKLNLFDCIDCGACAYVCPSKIPLVQYYRVAKAEIRQQQMLDVQADKAKIRFEARKHRLEQDKLAREEKHRKAAEARKAAMDNKTESGKSATSAVAAALARVKAKKSAQTTNESAKEDITETANKNPKSPDNNSPEKAQVAAAIARAKAKKKAAKDALSNTVQEKSTTEQDVIDNNEENKETISTTNNDSKKEKIAAAVAKAKLKSKERKATNTTSATGEPVKSKPAKKNTTEQTKSAKSKKQTTAKTSKSSVTAKEKAAKSKPIKNATGKKDTDKEKPAKEAALNTSTSAEDEKKRKIAAAVAKAKAKKQLKEETK